MQTLIAFALVLVLISIATVRYRLNPFVTLFSAAVVYGVLAGVPAESVVSTAAEGAGKIFALLGVVVFAGSVIAKVLEKGGFRERIFSDLRAFTHRPALTGGIAGFILAVPFMCCITAFIVISPLLSCFADKKKAIYGAAIGSTLSFSLIYPTPVTIAAAAAVQEFSAGEYMAVAFPLSVVLLLAVGIVIGRQKSTAEGGEQVCAPETGRRAWVPLLLPLALTAAAVVWPLFGKGSIPVALLVGMAVALFILAPDLRYAALKDGAKHAGVIIYDLCGAGALGATIMASTFATDAFTLFGDAVPPILVPFILGVLLQAAQGSRVVTAVITATMILSSDYATAIGQVPLMLMIAAGTLSVSAFSDPFFWVVRNASGDSVQAVLWRYALPLSAASLVIAAVAVIIEMAV
jgi:GntP family gluconate:H+ symporter